MTSIRTNQTNEIVAVSQAASIRPAATPVLPAASSNERIVDQAGVSSTSAAVATALATSDVRTEKVSGIQASLAAGTYAVSADALADKLISTLLG